MPALKFQGIKVLTRGAILGAAALLALAPTASAAVTPLTLTTVGTYTDLAPIGIGYSILTQKLIISRAFPVGIPNVFNTVNPNTGATAPFSSAVGYTDEVYPAVAGIANSSFGIGTTYAGNGQRGQIVKISSTGAVTNPWLILPPAALFNFRGGMTFDNTGVFHNNLLALDDNDGNTPSTLWEITAAGVATEIATLNFPTEGIAVVPNLPAKYGPMAGMAIVGNEDGSAIYGVKPDGTVTKMPNVNIKPENLAVVAPGDTFFGVLYANGHGDKIVKATPFQLASAGVTYDFIVGEEFTGDLYDLHWNGSAYIKTKLTHVNAPSQWEGTTVLHASNFQSGGCTCGQTYTPPTGLHPVGVWVSQ